jgi:hypothetical protein
MMSSDNPTGGDNQQETRAHLQRVLWRDPQRLYARRVPGMWCVMSQSELHGDMQSQAEMT